MLVVLSLTAVRIEYVSGLVDKNSSISFWCYRKLSPDADCA